MAVVVPTLGTCRISVMCRGDGRGLTQSQREDQVHGQKGERERERELLFHFSHEQAL